MRQAVPTRLVHITSAEQRQKISHMMIIPWDSNDSSYDSFVVIKSKNQNKPLNSSLEHRRVLNQKLRFICGMILTTLALLYLFGIIIAVILIVYLPKSNTTKTTGSTTSNDQSHPFSSVEKNLSNVNYLATTSISLVWNKTGITVAGVVGTSGNTPTTFNQPSGIVFDSSDALYVADENNHRIQKFVSGSTIGTTVSNQTSAAGCSAIGYMYAPLDVFVNTNQSILVTDSGCNNIRIWPKGASTSILFAGTGNPPGVASHQFFTSSGITVDSITGTIYISDSGNHRLMAYPVGARNGTRVAGGNGTGTMISQLNKPTGLFYDPTSNSLVIANTDAHNIVRWVLGAGSWTLIAGDANGISGSSSTRLNFPTDVIQDSMGNLYVADSKNHRIQFFRAGQINGTMIAGTGSVGLTSNDLNDPYSVALDSQMNLYVADRLNHRIQKFIRV